MLRRGRFVQKVVVLLMLAALLSGAFASSTLPGAAVVAQAPEEPRFLEEFWLDQYPMSIDEAFRTLDRQLLAKAAPDECFNGIGAPYIPDPSCSEGMPKVNGGYVFGLAKSGDTVWIGTAANMLCLVVATISAALPDQNLIPPHAASSWACEFDESAYGKMRFPDNPAWQKLLGDWRPPRVLTYDTQTGVLVEQAPDDPLIEETFGLRSAGAMGDIVFLAGPNLAAWTGVSPDGWQPGVNIFAFRSDGAYLGSTTLNDYDDIRKWLVVDGVLYTAVREVGTGLGTVLRWMGSLEDPFQFEAVGYLDNEGAELAYHEGRIFVTTWPTLSAQAFLSPPNPAGLYMSPPIPPGGLTAAHAGGWTKVWEAGDYERDPLIAATYLGGALASFDGYLYWGTIHMPLVSAVSHLLVYGIPTEPADLAATILGTHRPTTIFRGRDFGTGSEHKEVVYGLSYMPTYVPASDEWVVLPNGMGPPVEGPAGFGNFYNTYTWTMDVYGGQLFVGTFDWSYLFPEVLRLLFDAITGSEVPAWLQVPYPGYGADLWRFPSAGEGAFPESIAGAGNYVNYGVRTMIAEDALYLGMANPMNLLTDPNDPLPEGGWELIRLSGQPGGVPGLKGNMRIPFEATVLNMCSVEGGEVVRLKGRLHVNYMIHQSSGGPAFLRWHLNTQGVSGVGEVTKNRYTVNGNTHLLIGTGGLPTEFTYASRLNFIARGSADDLRMRVMMHVAVNERGEITANIIDTQVECR